MKERVTVIAHLRARPGKEKQTREALLALCGPTRAERGCINYDLHQSADSTALFAFHENWECKEDLDLHLKSAHVQGFFKRIDELLSEQPTITLWRFIG
jgi:quinol monooxygenase YgiN